MKKLVFSFLLSTTSLCSFSQGFDIGFSTVTSPLKVEGNYHINKLFDVGVFYGIGMKQIPHYFGTSFKYQTSRALNRSESKSAGYVGVNIGMSYAPSYTLEYSDILNFGPPTYVTKPAQTKFCGTAVFGYEKFVSNGKVSFYQEIHLGYMPNLLGYAFGLIRSEDPKKHYWWGYQVGMRIHFGK